MSTPRPAVCGQDLVGEVEGARVVDVRDAEPAEQAPLLGAAGGGEDLGPGALRELHRRHADAAGGGMDQDALAGLQCGRGGRARSAAVRKAIGTVAASASVSAARLAHDELGRR